MQILMLYHIENVKILTFKSEKCDDSVISNVTLNFLSFDQNKKSIYQSDPNFILGQIARKNFR